MLEDVVVDTNVLVHANNPGELRYEAACTLLENLLACETALCVDPGFDPDKAKNQSLIGHEYWSNLVPGMLGFTLLIELLGSERIREIKPNPPKAIKKGITQMVRKARDRTFVFVAVGSVEMILVSHDFEDFQPAKRLALKRRFGIDILDATACCGLV